MTIGLIDVDGHHFPNIALMKLSAWHKKQGDTVEWWWGFGQYDRVYMSKVFDSTYSQDVPEPLNACEIIKGGGPGPLPGRVHRPTAKAEGRQQDRDLHLVQERELILWQEITRLSLMSI